MAIHTRINRFNAGVWTPLLDGRTDLEDYSAALRTCTGMIPLKYGPAKSMKGFEYVADTKEFNPWILAFKFNQSTNYILETNGSYIRFFNSSTERPTQTPVTVDVEDVSNWAASTAYRYGELVRYGNTNATGTITSTGTAVVGVGTAFTTEFEVGDYIQEKGNDQIAKIVAITDDLNMTLDTTFSPIASGDNFAEVTLWAFDTLGGGTSAGSFTPGSWHALTQTTTAGTYIYEVPFDIGGSRVQASMHPVQVNDVMYFVNEQHAPRKLSRYGETDWRVEEIDYSYPPTLSQNTSTTTLLPGSYSGSTTMTASADTFEAGHVGSKWEWRVDRDAEHASYDLTTGGIKSFGTIPVFGDWTFTTTGTNWTDTLTLERSVNGVSGPYEKVYEVQATGSSQENFSITGNENDPRALYRLTKGANAVNGTAHLAVGQVEVRGVFEIDSLDGGNPATIANVTWTKPLDFGGTPVASTKWSEAAFSGVQGWPSAACFYQGRLWFGGTNNRKQTIWGSSIDDFENFGTSIPNVLASDSVSYTISSVEQNKIRWMRPLDSLIVGTTGEEYSIKGSDGNSIQATEAPLIAPESSRGSAYIEPTMAHNGIIFISQDQKKVFFLSYNWRARGYDTEDLSSLSENLFTSVNQSAFSKDPYNIFWCGNQGALNGLVFDRVNEVKAWFIREAGGSNGTFSSVASCYGGDSGDDIWVLWGNSKVCRLARDTVYKGSFFGVKARGRDAQCFLDMSKSEYEQISNPDPDLGSGYIRVLGAEHLGSYTTLTGTISSSGTTVTGSGTDFTGELSVGDYIKANGETQRVDSIASATSLETSVAFTTSLSGETFEEATGRSDVYALVNGLVTGPHQVRGDRISIEFGDTAASVIYGLKYTMELETMKLQAPAGDGFSRGKKKRAVEVDVGFDNTVGGNIGIRYWESDGQSGEQTYEIPFRTPQDTMDDPIPLFTGEKRLKLPQGSHKYFSLYYKQTLPLPATITYMSPQILPKGQ